MAAGIEILFALLTLSGLAYLLLALWGARDFSHYWRMRRGGVMKASATAGPSTAAAKSAAFAQDDNLFDRGEESSAGVSILKPVKGSDPRMYAGFVSHCRQEYAGAFEIVFGVSSLDDPAVAEVERLRGEFPEVAIKLVECRERLGTSGKVSNLVQMLREARYEHVLVNDSDIFVGPRYLERVMSSFADARVGMVTAPYLGRAVAGAKGLTVWSRLEALGISTDFMAGVLTARRLEGGIRFGLGSTLAMTKTALAKIGGMESLVECLADDYEMGARIAAAGYRVELSDEVVETTVPAYNFRGFWEHQMRWARSTRDSRKMGYVGLGITYAVPWALMTVVASGFALWSFSLLSLVLLARVAVALSVGVGVLRDEQVLRDLWLLPLRDCFGLAVWAWSFAGDTVVWRGERFRLRDGRMERV
jgi:ceramide glucosyltransferase